MLLAKRPFGGLARTKNLLLRAPQTKLLRHQCRGLCSLVRPLYEDEERRLGLDRQPYARDAFIKRFGAAEWERAAGRRFVELRYDTDGEAYSKREVLDYWSKSGSDRDGVPYEYWDACRHFAHKTTILLKEQTNITQIVAIHRKYHPGLDDIHLATCWHRIGVMASKSPAERRWLQHNKPELDVLQKHTIAMLPLFDAQGISNAAYGIARTGMRGSPSWTDMLDAIAKAAASKVRDFNPQDFSNTVWAYATSGHAAPELFDAIAKAAVPKVRDFKPQDFSNTVWAYAKSGHAAPELFDAIAKAAAPKVRDFDLQALRNTKWAYAKSGHQAPVLLEAISKATAKRKG